MPFATTKRGKSFEMSFNVAHIAEDDEYGPKYFALSLDFLLVIMTLGHFSWTVTLI